MQIVLSGQQLAYVITPAQVEAAVLAAGGHFESEADHDYDFSTSSDNGNTIKVEQNPEKRWTGILTAGDPGFAAVTSIVAKKEGTVIAVLGKQFYVARPEQRSIAGDELEVHQFVAEDVGWSNDAEQA